MSDDKDPLTSSLRLLIPQFKMYYFILANTESFVGDEYIPEVGLEIVLYLLDAGEPSTVRAHQAHAHTVYITMIMLTVSKKNFFLLYPANYHVL